MFCAIAGEVVVILPGMVWADTCISDASALNSEIERLLLLIGWRICSLWQAYSIVKKAVYESGRPKVLQWVSRMAMNTARCPLGLITLGWRTLTLLQLSWSLPFRIWWRLSVKPMLLSRLSRPARSLGYCWPTTVRSTTMRGWRPPF